MSGAAIRRRELLGGVALLGAAGAIGFGRMAKPGKAQVVVYEGHRPASRLLAHGAGAARRIDLSSETATHWRSLRTLGKGIAVAGFTGWDAYVAARGLLEDQGLRLVSETLDRRRGLVAWRMG
jgi:threonine dehydrogenase-like Zn-dependent dehydrogenase